ncbi:MAG: hypothetical protein BWK79_01395 [Beggiatoa sp. IS2]|nr:MAG: hypothetical protein BWK79_01395 [Beggiatoa sp. IS2]
MNLLKLTLYYLWLITLSSTGYTETLPSPASDNAATTSLVSTSTLQEREQAVQEEQNALVFYVDNLQRNQQELPNKIEALKNAEVTKEMLEKAALNKESAEVELKNLQLEHQVAEANFQELQRTLSDKKTHLETVRKTPAEPKKIKEQNQFIKELEDTIELEDKILQLERLHLTILKTRIESANDQLKLVIQWHKAVQEIYQTRLEAGLKNQVKQKQQDYLARATDLRKEMKELKEGEYSTERHYLLEIKLREAEELAQQEVRKLKLESIKVEISQAQAAATQESIPISKEMVKRLKALIVELDEIKEVLNSKVELLKQQLEITKKRAETLKDEGLKSNKESEKLLNSLIRTLQNQVKELPDGQPVLELLENAYKKDLRSTLLQQRKLPMTVTEWRQIADEMSVLPRLFMQELGDALLGFKRAFEQTSAQRWLVVSVIILIWLIFFVWMRKILVRVFERLNNLTKKGFGVNMVLIGLYLLSMNKITIASTVAFLLILWLTHPTHTTIVLSLLLLFSGLSAKIILNLLWLTLSDNNQIVGEYRKFYRYVREIVLLTWLLALITALGHLLNISTIARDFIDSLFMLFLSFMVLPINMRLHTMMLNYLSKVISGYWLLVIRFISLAIPLTLLAVSILGVIGYINLGWAVAKHLSLFLSVLIGWLIIRGLLADVISLLKDFAIKHSDYGLLWTQDVIPLLHKFLKITLFVVAMMTFLWINGWYDDALVRDTFEAFFSYPLFSISGHPIEINRVLLSILSLAIVFWLGGWIRQITYRWIYLAVSDLAARNSLATFTQYAVVLIGLLITLRLIGIDLTTITVFAGALGVGIGFGLQTIANNFISGIILLIERPIRAGDAVSIADKYSGRITKIGIRSLIIKTWDHDEVIVPNSELITNAFSNWTHSTPIRRMTLYIPTSYTSDPHLVMGVLANALQEVPEVLTEPMYDIHFWEFSDSALTFRVNYYIDMNQWERDFTKTKVLLSIWDHFKRENIEIPFPQRDVYVKSLPSHLSEP